MEWVDICGSPGSGKSTIADHFWGPHALPIIDALPPASWQPFVDEVTKLFSIIETHPTCEAAVRMNNRSFRKMATVARMDGSFPYLQTGLLQRLLGFGWRMVDMGLPLDPLIPAFQTMPVSVGVVFTKCNPQIVAERNRHRETVKATAHENREFMVPLMAPAIELAKEVLNARGCPIREISTEQPIDDARRELVYFAVQNLADAEARGHRDQMAVLPVVPLWWRH